jgi:AbrB family looped-hinge helix DNA binding protein
MGAFATTKLSSKGQVVIPEEIRAALHLKSGDRFMVLGKGDTVIFKSIAEPSLARFDELIQDAIAQARKAGLRKAAFKAAIKKARRKSK